jgi:peptidyl-prolyl cis-trans isomerase C
MNQRRIRQLLRALVTDRFVWFLLIGVLLFGVDRWRQSDEAYRIIVDLPLLEKLTAQWRGQTKRLPDANELDALVEGYVREEILVREARRLGLDQDDVIIRRRLAQKYEFFLAGADNAAAPDAATLRQFFDANRARYRLPETFTFNHVFVDDADAASAMAAQLNKDESGWRTQGRPFMLKRNYRAVATDRLAVDMGDGFVTALRAAPEGRWIGPVRSAFGVHAVKLIARAAGGDVAFDDVVARVTRDWQVRQQEMTRNAALDALRRDYTVELAPVDPQP